jgi:hypothetical protein
MSDADTPSDPLTWTHNPKRRRIGVSVCPSDNIGDLRIQRIPNGLGMDEWQGEPWAFIVYYDDATDQNASFEFNTTKMRALYAALGKMLTDRTDAEIAAEVGAKDADAD